MDIKHIVLDLCALSDVKEWLEYKEMWKQKLKFFIPNFIPNMLYFVGNNCCATALASYCTAIFFNS